MIFHKVCAV